MIRHFFTLQFLGFLAVGGTAAAVNWGSRLLLGRWMPFGWAVTLAYGIGMAAAFALNRRYVFRRSTRPAALQARDFVAVNAVSFPVVWLASIWIDAGLRAWGMTAWTEELAHGVAVALPTAMSFLIYKLVAFRELGHGRR